MATRSTPGRGRTPRPEPAHLAQARERRRKINSSPTILEIAAGNCERHARHLLALASFLRNVDRGVTPSQSEMLRNLSALAVGTIAGDVAGLARELKDAPRPTPGYRDPVTMKIGDGCKTCGRIGFGCNCGAHGCEVCGTGAGMCTKHGREHYERVAMGGA